ncbi:MAG: hypothetical protein JSW07_21975, partial [bacterium]
NENDIKNKTFQSLKKKLFQLFNNRKFLITVAIIVLITMVEFATDFVEIVLGSVIELTNPYRPKSGTIWELHKKDRLASAQLEEITKSLPDKKQEIPEINDLLQLKTKLEQQQSLLITADQFRNLYNQIPIRISGDIISPFDLLKLSHSRKWIWTKIVKNDSSLSFFFFDGDKQLLMDTYPPLSVLYDIPEADELGAVSLDSMAEFRGRTLNRDQFFTVFDDLPASVKLQLINNPFQLVKWDRNIQQIGISRYVDDNTVSVGFQVNQGIYIEVYTFEASDWAVDIFIEKLNTQYPELNFEYAEDKYSAFPDYF